VSVDLAIAVDLGGTQIRVALIDRTGAILRKISDFTRATAGPDIVIGQIAALVADVSGGVARSELAGAGVSSPGPLDTEAGVALTLPTLVGFENYPLRAMLSNAIGLEVKLENDGIAAAIGEWRFGAGQGFANVVYVTVSTGIGGGVIINNNVLRGRRGMAGHVGHMSFVQGGEMCSCGNCGCFEAYAAGPALARRWVKSGGSGDAAAVFDAARGGNGVAIRLVREEAEFLGQGFASLMHLYSPDVLVMGGGVGQQFDVLHADIMGSIRICAMPAFRDTPVVRAGLGDDSGLMGIAALVFARDRAQH
jgi:glucokinase